MMTADDLTGRHQEAGGILHLSGTLTLFGFPPEPAALEVTPRTKAWRGTRAAVFFGSGLILAPILGVVPPHAPWALGALAVGGFFGLRKWRERYTLMVLDALCPKCGRAVKLKKGTPVRPTLSVPCEGCHHDSRLDVPLPGNGESPPSSGPEGDHTLGVVDNNGRALQ